MLRFQIEASAKCRARPAQYHYAFIRLLGRDFDRGNQFVQQLNRQGVAPFRTIQGHDRDLRTLFLDQNDWHKSEVTHQKSAISIKLE